LAIESEANTQDTISAYNEIFLFSKLCRLKDKHLQLNRFEGQSRLGFFPNIEWQKSLGRSPSPCRIDAMELKTSNQRLGLVDTSFHCSQARTV